MAPMLILTVGLAIAVVTDVRTRRIPNLLTASMAIAGFVIAVLGLGVTPAQAALGLLVGLVVMMPGHVIGATGAGDVKLFAAAGAVLGSGRMVDAFVCTAIAGGVLAIGVALWRGRLARTVAQTLRLCQQPTHDRSAIEGAGEDNRFPYGPAIAAGCVIAALIGR